MPKVTFIIVKTELGYDAVLHVGMYQWKQQVKQFLTVWFLRLVRKILTDNQITWLFNLLATNVPII